MYNCIVFREGQFHLKTTLLLKIGFPNFFFVYPLIGGIKNNISKILVEKKFNIFFHGRFYVFQDFSEQNV